jgi:hypothetical protein
MAWADNAWAWWLVAPLVVPILVALVMWWRGRPRRPARAAESIVDHRRYLQALGSALGPAPSADRDG